MLINHRRIINDIWLCENIFDNVVISGNKTEFNVNISSDNVNTLENVKKSR